MGRPVDIARSNYVVPDYHVEFVEMIIALELANFNISNYSLRFDDSCISLEIRCYGSICRLSFEFQVSAKGLTKLISVGLSSERDDSLS